MNMQKIKDDLMQEVIAMHDLQMLTDVVAADACLNIDMADDSEVEEWGYMKTHEAVDMILDEMTIRVIR